MPLIDTRPNGRETKIGDGGFHLDEPCSPSPFRPTFVHAPCPLRRNPCSRGSVLVRGLVFPKVVYCITDSLRGRASPKPTWHYSRSSLAVCRILSSLQPIRPTSPLRFLSSQKIGALPQARTTGIAILTSSGVLEGGKNDNALRRIPFVGSFTPAHGSQGEQHLRRWATTARTRVNDVRPADPRYSRRDVGRQNLGRKYLGARNASQSPAARRSRRNREASARRTQKLRRLM